MLQKGTYKTVDELPNLLKGKEKVYNSVDELPDLKKKEGTGLVGGSFGGGAVGTSNGQLEFPKHKIVTDNTRQPIQLRQQEPIVEGNITYIQEEHPKEIAEEAKKLKAEKPTQSTFDGIGFMTQDIIEHGGGKALENLPVGLESLNLYFDNDANNAAEYFKRRNAEIDQQLKDLNQAKGDAIQPSKGDILLDNPKINQLTGKPFDNEQSDIDREREKLIKYKANLAKAQSALAKQYASKLTKGESVTEKGKVYNRIMGDEYTLEQDRLEEKGIPIKDREKYNRDIKGLEVAQQELQDEYSDKEKDDTYYERMAELNSMGKGILNKYPEYRKEQGANLIAKLAVKDPKLKMLASMGSGELDNSIKEYLEKTHGVSKKDLKGIEYGDIPSESFLGNVAKGLYNAGSSLVTGVTRAAGTALGADEDRLTYLNEQIAESGNKIFGNNPYEQLQDQETGKYNYNATTIKNAIGSGIGGLLGFIGGVKGVGKVLSLTDDAAMTGYIMGSSNEHNYQKANDILGKDAPEFEKELYATGMGYLEALAFKVLPKDKIFFNSPQTQKATKELAKSLSGMTINNINKEVLESGYKKVLKAALNTTEETAKIGGALSIAEMAKTATNVLLGDEEDASRYIQEGVENIEHMGRDLAFSMGIPLGLMEIPKYRSHSNRTKQTLYDAGENPGTHVATIRQAEEKGIISKEEADKRIEVVETMRGIVKSMPEKNPITEEPLTTNQKKEYAYNRVKEIAIKAKEAEIKDAALAPFFKKEAKELVDERTAIVTGTHDQYKETAALGDRIAATGKQKLITDVGTKSEVVDTLKDQALSTPITVSRMFKPYDAELTTDLIARNEPQKIKEELKSLKAEHKKLIEQEKKSEANEVQKNIDLLEEGLDKQKKPKEEEVTEPTPRTEVKTEKSPPSTGLSRGDVEEKEGFTEGKDLNKMFADLKSKYGDKKGSSLYEVANRLVNPNKNTIVEIRGNGVVVKEAGKYILKPFGNTDANIKKWTLYKGLDITDQFQKDKSLSPNIEPKTKEPSTNKEVVNEEAKVEVQQPAEVKSIAEEKVGGLAPETKTGEKEPPKEPAKPIEETPEDKFREKGILNRLFKAENTPKAAKEGFEKEGLKYEPQSVREAEQIGKAMVDEYGIEDAVTLAETNKFKGGVNSAIFADSLNRLYDQELAAKTPQEKIQIAQKFAEVGIRYDEFSRGKGRDIKQISHFYRKSPLGIQMIENAKRKEAFEEWSKPKDKSWKEFFDEMMKEPEFEKEINERVKEGMKKERAEARAARIKKVDEFFDKAKNEFKGGAAYSTIIPPKVITAAIDGMKLAYHAGEKVVELVQNAIDYISEQLGHDTWDKEKFRKEWEGKLKDKTERKPLTDEELKTKILDKFRKKLKGLTDKEKEEVVRKSFQKIVESGGLDYADFKKIIADITGRGELTAEEAARLKELVKETNAVDEAAEKARTDVDAQGKRKQENREAYFKQVAKAAKATRELNEILYNRPNITKRLTSIMQLNTLGIPALVNNPIYNIVNQLGLRFPVGVLQSVIERGIQVGGKIMGKDVQPEINNLSLKTQAEFFKKLGLGVAESVEQFGTGLNRADYTAKELHTEQIRPATAIRDLWKYFKGEKNLSNEQLADKIIQATVGIPAEGVARTLNVGDKPQRFAAQGNRGAAFAKRLGLKDIDYDLFIDFPREEAFMQYKKKGLSDAEAAKKADYIADTIIKEGQRSTFQQDNMLNDVINRAFGGEKSGIGSLAKAVTISPYIKIPSNAYWSYYNLINPEVAFLQSMIYGAKAYAKKSGKYTRFLGDKYNTSAAKDLNEAKYWFAHGAVGIATRAVIVSLVGAGIARPSNTEDDTKKEREGEQNYEQQGTINVSKLWAAVQGRNPDEVKNGLNVQMRWFGHWGTMSDAVAQKNESMTAEQKEKQKDFMDIAFGGMEIDALKHLNQGVFGNTSSLLTAVERKDFQNYGVNLINMFANIVQPAALAQVEKASMPYYTKQKADTFLGELNNTMLSRSKLYRDLTNQYPPSKIGIWGDKVEKKDNFGMRLFGISRANPDNFAQPIYDDYKKTNNIKFFPPSVRPVIEGNGQVINLPTKDAARLEELVGQQRKNMISPYVNDMATFEGSSKTYSQLTDEEKLDKLNIIYDEGYKNGKELFLKEHPEYIIPEKTKQDKKEDKKESRANKKFRKAISSKY